MLLGLTATAKEKMSREHGAHLHGAGSLGIAFEENKGRMEFKIPSDSIIGFEYTPKTNKDKKTKQAQLEILEKNISEMVVFNSAIKCQIIKDKIEIVKDGGESKEPRAEHSTTFATFNVKCDKPPAGTKISFNFHKFFPRIQDLDVQIIAGSIQKSIEVKQSNVSVELK
jgi:hypothetical protein